MQSKTTRRTFVKSLTAGGILAGLGLWRTPVWAVTSPGQPTMLSGSDFELFIGEPPVNITGSARTAMTINGTLPGPSCDGKFVEGHVPAAQVLQRARRDDLAGIAAPGMPAGSPGMEAGAARHAYQVIALTTSGTDQVLEAYPAKKCRIGS